MSTEDQQTAFHCSSNMDMLSHRTSFHGRQSPTQPVYVSYETYHLRGKFPQQMT